MEKEVPIDKEVKKKSTIVLSQRLVFGNKTFEVGHHEVSQKEKEELQTFKEFKNFITYL